MELRLTGGEFKALQELVRINEIRSSNLGIKREINHVLKVNELSKD